jgi:hypothetical protein
MPPTVLFSGGMFAPRARALVLFVLVVALGASPALAQDGFRLSYDVDQSRPEKARLTGRITNDRPQDVFEVSVTAEALDARGKVLARGISYVDSRIARGDSRTFAVSVPTVPGATNYRVVVSSFRTGFGATGTNQGP